MRRRLHPTPADLGLTPSEGRTLRALSTPERIQDFLDALPANFEEGGDTLRSVRGVLRAGKAHCIEAAFLAACALWLQGRPPLVMDLVATRHDADHVVALFRRDGAWGAISKSNHIWLRWRDAVYRTPRELAMSCFHEYTEGRLKTLRTYSRPIDMRRFALADWITAEEDCWEVGAALDEAPHERLLTPAQIRHLRPRDAFEQEANRIVAWRPAGARRTRSAKGGARP